MHDEIFGRYGYEFKKGENEEVLKKAVLISETTQKC